MCFVHQELISQCRGRVPYQVERSICRLMSSYSSNITSVLSQFPSQAVFLYFCTCNLKIIEHSHLYCSPVWTMFLNIFFFFFCVSSYISGVQHLGEIFVYVTVLLIQSLRQSHSVFMDGACWVCFCCRSRAWMSGSFESVRWNACVHRLDLGLYCHLKERWRNGVWTLIDSKGKIPSTGKKINCERYFLLSASQY